MRGKWAVPVIASILILGTLGLSQDAQASLFESSQTGFWDDPSTWGVSGVPGAINNVKINNGHVVTIRDERVHAFRIFTINSGGELVLQGSDFTHSGELTFISSVVTNNGKITINGGDVQFSGFLSIFSGSFTNNNEIIVNGGSAVQSGEIQTSRSDSIFDNNGIITLIGGSGPVTGFFANVNSAVVNNLCDGIISIEGGIFSNSNGATLVSHGTFTKTGGLFVNSATILHSSPIPTLDTNTGTIQQIESICDTTPPVVTPPPNQFVEATSPSGAVVTYPPPTATDDVGVAIGPSCTPSSGSTFALGVTTVTCTAEDAAGNVGTATFTVTVQDTTPPVLTIPADITTEATGLTTPVDIGAASATDIFPVIITNDAPSEFSLGDTIVTWTATDSNGNSASATQTITVVPLQVAIEIKPGSDPNVINPDKKGKTMVAIISTIDFDAVTEVDKTSLTFGRTGNEQSLLFCTASLKKKADVNKDGLLDQICHFDNLITDFQQGDIEGVLKGNLKDGTPIIGIDSVTIK